MEGKYELKRQINKRGHLSIIELELTKSKDKTSKIDFEIEVYNDHRAAIEFGVYLAFEKIRAISSNRIYNICIKKFKWTTIDTDLPSVSLSACCAIYNALGCESKMPYPQINDRGEFVF